MAIPFQHSLFLCYLFFRPIINRRSSTDLGVLFDDIRSPPFGDQRTELALEWKLDDVLVQEESGQELLDLIALSGTAHVQHEDSSPTYGT